MSPELQDILIDLSKARSSDRLAVGKAAPVRVDRKRTTNLGLPSSDDLLLFTVLAQTILSHVHNLGARFRVLELGKVHVAGTDSRHLERSDGGIHGRTFGAFYR